MSKSLSKVLASLVILFFTSWSAISAGQTSDNQDTIFVRAHAFLRTFYPELLGKDLLLNLHATQSIDHTWRQSGGIRFDVKLYDPLSERMLNPPVDGKTGKQLSPPDNTVLLEGLFTFNQEGRLEHMFAAGDVVHSKQNDAIRKLVESHPEWSEDEAVGALKKAGARYGPADRDQFLQAIHLERFARSLGRLKIELVEFNELSPDHTGSFAAAAFNWTVKAEGRAPNRTHCRYSLGFEPFGGKLISVSRME